MLDITVRTLDSQNHKFSVQDDYTVLQFKEHIADTVHIPAATQRIIYCGRVLADESKLVDLDVNGKVVHLVERPPPSDNQVENGNNGTPSPHHHAHQRVLGGNAMYLGSMAIPFEPQNIMPPPPTFRLAASRLNVARRMLRRAEATIALLENPTARPAPQGQADDVQVEVTPVFEARVIVPASSGENLDETLMNAVHNTLLNNAANMSSPSTTQVNDATPVVENANGDPEVVVNVSAIPSDESTPISTSTEDLAGDAAAAAAPAPAAAAAAAATANASNQTSNNNNGAGPENISRTSEMADLLDTLARLHQRFAPFLERYHTFMREDPAVTSEEVRSMDRTFTRISEVLHYLGHAYHSLSDMIIRVRSAPPRRLVCRPILIQQTAVLPAGFPIQVEAQINIASDPTAAAAANASASTTSLSTTTPNPNATQSSSATSTTVPSTEDTSGQTQDAQQSIPLATAETLSFTHFDLNPSASATNTGAQTQPQTARMTIPQFDFMNIPGIPQGSTVHVQSIPIGIRTMRTSNATRSASTGNAPNSNAEGNNGAASGNTQMFGNPNLEFFMEVTPESITIDSLETTLLGSSQTDGGPRTVTGSGSGPPGNLFQSIMQMAGQLVNRSASTSNVTVSSQRLSGESAPTTARSATATTAASTVPANTSTGASASSGASSNNAGQNSQARGNTQTNPTTATHTRSTPRPHVHFAQHAIQGFDPFLPCNSHHIMHLRRQSARSTTSNNNNNSRPHNGNRPPQDRNNLNPVFNLVQGVLNSLNNIYGGRPNTGTPPPPAPPPGGQQSTQSTASTTTNAPPPPPPPAAVPSSTRGTSQTGSNHLMHSQFIASMANMPNFLLPHLNPFGGDANARSGPTIAQLLQQTGGTAEGDGLFNDFIMLLSRNLTIGDVVQLNAGRLDPLLRIRNDIRTFVTERVLEGNAPTPSNVERAVNKLLTEMQPVFSMLPPMPANANIDLVRSMEMLFRVRLPNIIQLSVLRRPGAMRNLVEQLKLLCRHLAALVIHSNANGRAGFEDVVTHLVARYMHGVPNEMVQWTQLATRTQLQDFINNLDVTESALQPYIIRTVESLAVTTALGDATASAECAQANELMEIETDELAVDVQVQEQGSRPHSTNVAQDDEEDNSVAPPNVLGTIDVDENEGMPHGMETESWHEQVPPDWVPIIARDTHRQRRQNQAPLSDAYLSGMPNKRRKVVTTDKPQGTLPQVISDSLRRAVTTSGLASVGNVDDIAQEAGADLSIQSAYRDLLRTSVQASLQDNEDFTPERFPNASSYFNSKPQ